MKNFFNSHYMMVTFLFFLPFFIFFGCQDDKFKSNALRVGKTLQKSHELVEISGVRSNIGKDQQRDVIITYNTKKSGEYLIGKKEELGKQYEIIKSYLIESSNNYIDAIYILALTNKIYYLYAGNSIEVKYKYTKLIKKEINKRPSDWVINKIFGPILSDEGNVDEWIQNDTSTKLEQIKNLLFEYDESKKNTQD